MASCTEINFFNESVSGFLVSLLSVLWKQKQFRVLGISRLKLIPSRKWAKPFCLWNYFSKTSQSFKNPWSTQNEFREWWWEGGTFGAWLQGGEEVSSTFMGQIFFPSMWQILGSGNMEASGKWEWWMTIQAGPKQRTSPRLLWQAQGQANFLVRCSL